MDWVIAFFGNARVEDVMESVREIGLNGHSVGDHESGAYCFFDEYPFTDQMMELDESHRKAIQQRIGGSIACAITLRCHTGIGARFTLEMVERLMRLHKPAVLDDDYGGLWSWEDVLTVLRTDPGADVFSLRRAPDISSERTNDE